MLHEKEETWDLSVNDFPNKHSYVSWDKYREDSGLEPNGVTDAELPKRRKRST